MRTKSKILTVSYSTQPSEPITNTYAIGSWRLRISLAINEFQHQVYSNSDYRTFDQTTNISKIELCLQPSVNVPLELGKQGKQLHQLCFYLPRHCPRTP